MLYRNKNGSKVVENKVTGSFQDSYEIKYEVLGICILVRYVLLWCLKKKLVIPMCQFSP